MWAAFELEESHMQWRIARASVIGTGHIRADMPCQDSNYVMQVGDSVIIAVSDGLGSAKYSDVASQFVCRTVVDHLSHVVVAQHATHTVQPTLLQKLFGGTDAPAPIIQQAMIDATVATRDALVNLAQTNGHELREYGCTLMVAILAPNDWHVLHIGDGAVVGLESATVVKTLSTPDNGEYINVTVPLTSSEYRSHLRYAQGSDALYGMALLSDGVQPMCINYKTGVAYPGFFTPLIQWLAAIPETELSHAHPNLSKLLDSDKLRQKSDDDMTLVLVLRHTKSDETNA